VHPVTLISYGLWQRRYAGAADIVGKDVMMNGSRRTIIGVMPRDFVFASRLVDFWNPMSFLPADIAQRNSHYLNVVARLAPGVTVKQAGDDMHDVAARLARDFPDSNRQLGAVVVPIKEDALGDTRLELILLLAAAGCVLLLACANIAALLLSRGVSRRSELAVRAALGATGPRLVRQIMAESMVLALAGGALGVALAPLAMRTLVSMVPVTVPPPEASSLDVRALAFAGILAIATGMLFSIVPAIQTVRGSLA
jgi:putative ABC transport system permease protein